MRYVAELFYLEEGQHYSIDTADIEADTDTQAGDRALEWAEPIMSEMLGRIAYLQVAAGGRSAFSKTYGES
jgi:hypothetical protein